MPGSSSMHSGRRIYVGLLRVYNITMTGIFKYFPKNYDAFFRLSISENLIKIFQPDTTVANVEVTGSGFLPLACAWNTAF